ncbi:hypothetical protein AB0L30_23100 [Microbispora rosea]
MTNTGPRVRRSTITPGQAAGPADHPDLHLVVYAPAPGGDAPVMEPSRR